MLPPPPAASNRVSSTTPVSLLDAPALNPCSSTSGVRDRGVEASKVAVAASLGPGQGSLSKDDWAFFES